jgi:hypothetical protein
MAPHRIMLISGATGDNEMTELLDQGAAAVRLGKTSARDVAPRLHDRPFLAMAQRAETALG